MGNRKAKTVSIEIDGEKLSDLIKSKKKSFRSIEKELGYGKDYIRDCVKRNHIDENRFICILSHLRTSRQTAEIETQFDLSTVPTWQLLDEVKARGVCK